jgi:cellulose synthase (UDP-forming)
VALAWNALNTLVLGIFLSVTYREARVARAVRRTTRRDARRQSRQDRRRRHAATAPVDPSPAPSTTLVGGPR